MGIFRQFPYSNFHDMNMDTVLRIMREMQDEWEATKTEWASYKDFIDNYFANLDVSEEVLEAIRVLAASGELNQIIDPVIANETAEWLADHITPTTPPVDTSLTITGAAADSKTVGDKFKSIKNEMDNVAEGIINGSISLDNIPVTKQKAIRIADGVVVNLAGSDTWAITDFYPIPYGINKIKTNFFVASSTYGFAVYDENQDYITGGTNMTDINILPTYKYIRLTNYNAGSDHSGLYITFEETPALNSVNDQTNWNKDDLTLLLDYLVPVTEEAGKYASMSAGVINIYNIAPSSVKKYDVSNIIGETVYFSAVRNAAPYTTYIMISDDQNNYIASVIDASHDFIVNGSIVIPDNAKYMYLNYLTESGRGQAVIDYNAKRVISRFAKAFLWSAAPIYWNWQAGKIQSASAISIVVPSENYNAVLATVIDGIAEVSCGTSRFLYYNKNTKSLTTNGTVITNSSTMLLIGACQAHEIDYLTLQKGTNKKCACFGDSITWYDGNPYNWGKFNGEIAVGFETWLKRIFGLAIYNYGASGETAVQICNRVRSGDFTSMDYLILTSGANDERHNTTLGVVLEAGSTFDTDTFCGAFQSAIESALADNPELKIVLCTPIQGWIYANGYDETDYPDHPASGDIDPKWANAIKRIAEVYALPVCDWYNESGINLCTRDVYINDPEPPANVLYSLHPTPKGYERMSEILAATMNKVMAL